VRFKYLPLLDVSTTMPLLLDVEISSSLQKSGSVTTPSISTAASTASHQTSLNADGKDNFTFLAMLQGIPIHAPPGPQPLCTGAKVPTKTQMKADQKTKKEAKLKAAEEKKLAISISKVETAAKKQEKLIFDTESNLAKATAKAEELHLKLAEAGDTPLTAAQDLPLWKTWSNTPTRRARGFMAGHWLASWLNPNLTFLPRERERLPTRRLVCNPLVIFLTTILKPLLLL
jgi:hypothetical protein